MIAPERRALAGWGSASPTVATVGHPADADAVVYDRTRMCGSAAVPNMRQRVNAMKFRIALDEDPVSRW